MINADDVDWVVESRRNRRQQIYRAWISFLALIGSHAQFDARRRTLGVRDTNARRESR